MNLCCNVFPACSGEHIRHEGSVDIVARLAVSGDFVWKDWDAVIVEGNNVLVTK